MTQFEAVQKYGRNEITLNELVDNYAAIKAAERKKRVDAILASRAEAKKNYVATVAAVVNDESMVDGMKRFNWNE